MAMFFGIFNGVYLLACHLVEGDREEDTKEGEREMYCKCIVVYVYEYD